MASIFISDGMTLDFTIDAQGPFSELTGKYRLATPERTAEWQFDRVNKVKSGKERHALNVSFIVEHLNSWSAEEPIKKEWVKKLPDFVINELCSLISGYSFSDRATSEKNSSKDSGSSGSDQS